MGKRAIATRSPPGADSSYVKCIDFTLIRVKSIHLTFARRLDARTRECAKPKALRDHSDLEALKAYYLKTWPYLVAKWKKVGALDAAFDKNNPLGQWRECVQSVYHIDLPL
jgi:hypothetical protein